MNAQHVLHKAKNCIGNRSPRRNGGKNYFSVNPLLCAVFLFLCAGLLHSIIPSDVSAQGVISLPRTGQTKCYDMAGTEIACAGTGQNGDIRAGVGWPEPRFTVSSDCVTDNLTGLMWARNADLSTGTHFWNNAIDFANDLLLCGFSDWRLPNVNELESLINAGAPNNRLWLIDQGFTNVPHDVVAGTTYQSSSTCLFDTGNAWYVELSKGNIGCINKNSWGYGHGYVWPVRGETTFPAQTWKTGQTMSFRPGDDGDLQKGVDWPTTRFVDNGDGTVTDGLTGLTWPRDLSTPGSASCNPGTKKTWQASLDYVKCLNTTGYLGKNDWRLPNRKELFSTIDRSQYYPAIELGHPFQNAQSDFYWSSTTYPPTAGNAWAVRPWDGREGPQSKGSSYFVCPVRGGLIDPAPSGYFVISALDGGAIPNQTPGVPFDIKLTARNVDGTIKTDCTGTVYLSSSNGNITPIKSPLAAGGVTTISVKIGAPGGQNIQIGATGCGLSGASNTFNVGSGCTTGSIGGSVKQNKVLLPEAATVNLWGGGGYYTTTSENGRYNFTSIPSGFYTLWASYNGGESDRVPVYVSCYSGTEELNIFSTCDPGGKTPVLLVPGIMGSTLKKNPLKIIPTLHNNGFVDPSEIEIYDDFATEYGWKNLKDILTSNGYVEGCTLFDVPYDWRMRVEDAMQAYLKPAITRAKEKSGSPKVNIIAHSMGGLVARAYIQSTSFQNDIDRFAMIGTPNHGSAMAYPLWDGGEPFSADAMAMDITSLKVLPVYTGTMVYLVKGSGEAKSAMDNLATKIVDGVCDIVTGYNWLCMVKDVMELYTELATYTWENIPSLWQLLPTYSFLDPHGELQCQQNTWLEAFNSPYGFSLLTTEDVTDPAKVRTKIFYGNDIKTVNSIKAGWKWCSSPFYPDGIPYGFTKPEAGDGTVLTSSVRLDGEATVSYGDPVEKEHAKLVNAVANDVAAFIDAGASGLSTLPVKMLEADAGGTPSLSIATLGRIRPLITSPTGQKSGIENNLSVNDIPNTSVVIGIDAGGITIDNPADGMYTIALTNSYAENYEVALSYADATGANILRTARGFNNAGTTSFTFTLNSGISDKIIINHTPLPPLGFLADAIDSGGLMTMLSWTQSSSPSVSGYSIYAKLVDEPFFSWIGTTASTSFNTGHPWAADASVKARLYAVSAVEAGTESFFSNMVKNNDRDHDGITDEQETLLGTNVSNPDTDGDGLKDGEEFLIATNPLLADTDADGYSDYAEVAAGSDPLDQNITPANMPRMPGIVDFDKDQKADITVWRPGDGYWYTISSKDGSVLSWQWGSGALNDIPVAGDYDGDGKTDCAVWRPGETVRWYVLKSSGGVDAIQWGSSSLNDKPVPGDYDGDGKTDIAVWRPGDGYWYIISSKDGSIITHQWGAGALNDVPVPADYDGDGKTDYAVWRPMDGYWYIINSKDGSIKSQQWGSSSLNDVLVPGDYDGDGKTDIAVWRPAEGYWYIISSKDGSIVSQQWGAGYAPYNDVPVPGDYDGDGKTDFAVWRLMDGYWYILKSSDGGVIQRQWGAGYPPYNDEPISQKLNW